MLGIKTADVLDSEPESSPRLLGAIDNEIKKVNSESDKVKSTLDQLEAEAGDLEGAKQEAEAAQLELDEIEAGELLGDADEVARRQAVAALNKARSKAQKAQDEASRREAAARGLRRKHEALSGRIDALSRKRAEVALLVYRSEIEQAEIRLIEMLKGNELAEIMESLNASVRNYRKAQKVEDTNVGAIEPRVLKIELPSLMAHPDRKRLTGRDSAGILTI
ncbi:hypothetical protein R3F64_15680 [Halomonas sp. 5021]|jgi:hypothetical protein|uniref:hypothetical protein n=1 Tax=Halomonas sp. 5021 TaxID=3082156 RepID=UPI002FCBFA66